MKGKTLSIKAASRRAFFLMVLMLALYMIENSPLVKHIGGFTFSYLVRPAIWLGVIILVHKMPRPRAKAKLRHRSFIYFWAFNFAILYILVNLMGGLVNGVGRSPYSHSIRGIVTNIIFIGLPLIGRELIRNHLVNGFSKKEDYSIFILFGFLTSLVGFSINKYLSLDSLQALVEFLGGQFLPDFSHHIFASYLVYLGGPLTSIIYLGIIQTFHWLSPILPDLKWITTALIGMLCPIFFMMSLQKTYLQHCNQVKRRDKEEGVLGWLLTSIVSIGIIWFAVGVFPIYPSVIATGSMEPGIRPGDVIIVERIRDRAGIDSLEPGDIIQFTRGDILISHRIMDVVDDKGGGPYFRTKGDNNPSADGELVKAEDIKGIIRSRLAKLGWPSLLIRSGGRLD